MVYIIIIYILLLLIYFVYSFAAVYHLFRYGYAGDLTRPIALIYIILSAVIIIFTIIFLLGRDWSNSLISY